MKFILTKVKKDRKVNFFGQIDKNRTNILQVLLYILYLYSVQLCERKKVRFSCCACVNAQTRDGVATRERMVPSYGAADRELQKTCALQRALAAVVDTTRRAKRVAPRPAAVVVGTA